MLILLCNVFYECDLACAEIDLKKASKAFASHFSCGSSVTGEDEVVIQGDVTDDLVDFLLEKYPQVVPEQM